MGLQVRMIVKGLDLVRRELALPAGNQFRPGTEGDAEAAARAIRGRTGRSGP
jgi:hypothetical protein